MIGKNKPEKDDHLIYKHRYLLMAVALVFTAILSVTYWQITWIRHDQNEQALVLRVAETIGSQIHYYEVEALEGNENDLDKPEHKELKGHLNDLVTVSQNLDAAYLLREVDGEIVFLLDYLPLAASDFVPPGLVFDFAPEKLSVPYTTKKSCHGHCFIRPWNEVE